MGPEDSPAEATSVPSSLPLTDGEGLSASPPALVPAAPRRHANAPKWKLPHRSKVRKTALKIVAFRLRGFPDSEIAQMVGLKSAETVRGYLWRAGKNGWLPDEIDNPRDRLDYDLMHKVVRNMGQALDDCTDLERRDKMTLEVAKGTIFKTYDPQQAQAAAPLNVLSINIEMPTGPAPTIREGTTGGAPAFVDADVVESPDADGQGS